MPAKRKTFPYRVTKDSCTVTIYKNVKKGGNVAYLVAYRQAGKRLMESLSDWETAKRRAEDLAEALAAGMHVATQLKGEDKLALVRATDALTAAGINLAVDAVVSEYVAVREVLQGRATPLEAARDWIKRHAVALPRVSVADAVAELLKQAAADRKSQRRITQLESVLNAFADSMNCDVTGITPALVSDYLSGMKSTERTKANHRDVLGYFSRWCVLRGYLPKGADMLEGVQKYRKRKTGEIHIYTPEEMAKLLGAADERLVPFIAISGFAGLRHAEAARLDWSEVELSDVSGESFIEVKAGKSKVDTRRLVPVSDNLKAWLLPRAKTRGKVCPFANITKQLLKCADDAEVNWKHNGLRHSAISYRVAETGDVARVADWSGNSPTVIRSNYLKRVKPAQAAAWFAIMPETPANVAQAPTGKVV